MKESKIFFKGNNKQYTFRNYDCCESLGQGFASNGSTKMYVAIPKKEMIDFFDKENLDLYLDLLSHAFDIPYEVANDSDLNEIDLNGSSISSYEDAIFVKISPKERLSNKRFNVAYNAFRYLWYHHYTNMAIIATNIYKMHIVRDPMDILAIAFSYQETTDRAVLPVVTAELPGLLFFRPKDEMLKDLSNEVPFNTIFYRYPIYFDPTVKVNGTFFTDSSTIIKAKDLFSKLVGIEDLEDIPEFMLNNFQLVYNDYMSMRSEYLLIKRQLDQGKYTMRGPIYLSKTNNVIDIPVINPAGSHTVIKVNYMYSILNEPTLL